MKTCEFYEEWLQLSLDGLLPSEQERELEEHLAQCPDCRARYDQFRAMRVMLARLNDREPVPPQLHQRIMNYVEQNSPMPRPISRRRRWYRAAAGAAACLLTLFAVLRFLPGQGSKENSAQPAALRNMDQMSAYSDEGAGETGGSQPTELYEVSGVVNSVLTAPASKPAMEGAGLSEGFADLDIPMDSTEEFEANSATPEPGTKLWADLAPMANNQWEVSDQISYRTHKESGTAPQRAVAVAGSREALPDWAAEEPLFCQTIGGETRDCLALDLWKQISWTEGLIQAGFSVEPLESEDLSADPESQWLLLVFFWE